LPEAIVRTAEEFFPIVNALRPLMLYLAQRGLDPFDMLLAWSQWIGEENARAGNAGSGMYAGTIAQFIEFLSSVLPTLGQFDDVVAEMLRWEKAKNKLRTLTSGNRLPVVSADATEEARLTRNPTLLIECFRHSSSFLSDIKTDASGIFAFYRHADGSSAIVALGELAALVLEVARETMTQAELALAIGEADEVLAVIRRLRDSELLVVHVDEDGGPVRDHPDRLMGAYGASGPPIQ
jgi:hypothetical protein